MVYVVYRHTVVLVEQQIVKIGIDSRGHHWKGAIDNTTDISLQQKLWHWNGIAIDNTTEVIFQQKL